MSFIFCPMITEIIKTKVVVNVSSEVKIAELKTGLQLDKD